MVNRPSTPEHRSMVVILKRNTGLATQRNVVRSARLQDSAMATNGKMNVARLHNK